MRQAAWLALLVILIQAPAPAGCEERDVFMKFTAGGSYPYLENLDMELDAQGREGLSTGYSLGISLGKLFAGGRYGLELWVDYSRYPYFDYINEYEDFEGQATHYNFMLAGKLNLIPGDRYFVPYVGCGLGYGRTHIGKSGGKIDGICGLVLLQAESRITGNISVFLEGSYLAALGTDRYDSAFLEGTYYDGIMDSNGELLEDRYSAAVFRIGVLIWLRQPSR
jgi:hypothetical protein